MNSQMFIFVGIFVAILLVYIFFINRLSKWLEGRVPVKIFNVVEGIIIGGILLGIFMLFQPFTLKGEFIDSIKDFLKNVGYKYGFTVLLFSTLLFIVWSHITPVSKVTKKEE